MKKILLILAYLLPLAGIGQGTQSIKVKKVTADTVVITKSVSDTSGNILVLDAAGRVKVNRSAGGGTDYWTYNGTNLYPADTAKGFYPYVGGLSAYAYMLAPNSGQSVIVGTYNRLGTKAAAVTINSSTGYINQQATAAAGTDQVQVTGGFGFLSGSSTANTNNRMNLGSASQPWGQAYLDSVQSTGIIRAYGGNSTNWNTAYGWGNHALAGYITSQPWVTSGSNIYYSAGKVGVGITPSATDSALQVLSMKSSRDINLNGLTVGRGMGSLTSNAAFGANTMGVITTGNYNTGVGHNVMFKTTTGAFNIGAGFNALYNNVSGSNLVAIGRQSLLNNTTGQNNTAVGSMSAYNTSTGYSNTAVGVRALYSNTTASNLVAVGDSALYSNTTGKKNTAIGSKSMWKNTTGTYNVAVGDRSLDSNTTGNFNIGIGPASIFNNRTRNNLIGIGDSSLYWNLRGYENIGIGSKTLYNNSDGNYNTAVGYKSMYSNNFGSNNSAYGYKALYSNTEGAGNLANGYNSLYKNTTGSNNVAVGNIALYENVNGDVNVAIGSGALSKNISGDNNVAVGSGTLSANTSGNSSTAIGYNSMISNTTGSSNTSIGLRSLYLNTTGHNNIAIGDSAGYSYTNLSNRMYLGAIDTTTTGIYFNHTAGINKGYWLGALNVKTVPVGTSSPSRMIVQDTVTGDIKRLPIPTSTTYTATSPVDVTGTVISILPDTLTSWRTKQNLWKQNGANIYNASGSVGIGNSNPATALEVTGTATLPTILGGSAVGSNITYTSTSGAGTTGGIAHQFKGGTNGATTIMTMLNNGNVGIGITNPTQLLTVVGNSRFNGVIDMSTSGVLSWSSGNAEISQNSNDIIFKTYTGSALTEKFRIKNLGNIGIGTTAPAAKLHTIGTIQSGTVAKVTVDSVNAVRLSGNATVWDDLMMPFSTGTTAGTGYPTYNADSMYHSFVVDTTGPSKCIIYMPIQLPHKWKEGSTIYPHIHYRHSTTQGTPTFRIKYKWVNIGATTGTWNWYTMSTTTGTTNLTHQMVYNATGISGSGNTISSMLLMQIYLVNTSTATKTCDAFQFDIHVEHDALGSNSETSKN